MSDTKILLPKGIQLIQRGKRGEIVNFYRVQMNRKNVKVDQFFDNPEEAVAFLNEQRKKLKLEPVKLDYVVEMTQEAMLKELEKSYLVKSFEAYVKIYLSDYVEPRYRKYKNDISPEGKMKYRNFRNIESFYKTIINTPVRFFNFGGLELVLENRTSAKDVKFGNLNVDEIDEEVINNYIRARASSPSKIDPSKTIKAQSIQREITYISNVFRKLKSINRAMRNIENPCLKYDKDLLKLAEPSRRKFFRFSEEDKLRFIKDIDTHENPDFARIIKLMLMTAMRRSEVVLLKWSQVKENYIELYDTKTNPRPVFLTQEAKDLLESIPKRPNQDRIFKYTVLGFDGSLTKWLKDRGYNLTSHSLRKEAISNFIDSVGASNSLMVSSFLGIRNVSYFEKRVAEMPMNSPLQSQADVLKSVGHRNSSVTKEHYYQPDFTKK